MSWDWDYALANLDFSLHLPLGHVQSKPGFGEDVRSTCFPTPSHTNSACITSNPLVSCNTPSAQHSFYLLTSDRTNQEKVFFGKRHNRMVSEKIAFLSVHCLMCDNQIKTLLLDHFSSQNGFLPLSHILWPGFLSPNNIMAVQAFHFTRHFPRDYAQS